MRARERSGLPRFAWCLVVAAALALGACHDEAKDQADKDLVEDAVNQEAPFCTCTEDPYAAVDVLKEVPELRVTLVTYLLCIVLGASGNLVTLFTMATADRKNKSGTNIFLISLSVRKSFLKVPWEHCSRRLYVLVVFPTCGGIRTGVSMPILAGSFPCWLRASWERVDSRRLPYMDTDSSTRAGTGCTDYSLSVAVLPTANL